MLNMLERVITRCEIDGCRFCYCSESKKFVTVCENEYFAETKDSIHAWVEYCRFANDRMTQKINSGGFQRQKTSCNVDGYKLYCDGSGKKYAVLRPDGTKEEFNEPIEAWDKYLDLIQGYMIKRIFDSLRNRVISIMSGTPLPVGRRANDKS